MAEDTNTKFIYARVEIIRAETNASNYTELAFQDYYIFSIYNLVNPL